MGEQTIAQTARTPRVTLATGAWTLVLRGRFSGYEAGSAAMERLCLAYSPAVEAFLIRWSADRNWAKNRGQDFSQHICSGNGLRYLRSECRCFREFLLEALQVYLADDWKLGLQPLTSADSAIASEASKSFGRRWAMTALERAIMQMEAEGKRSDSPELYFSCCEFLAGARQVPYQSFTTTFGLSRGATDLALQRLRLRFGDFLRAEIRETVRSEELVFSEIETLREFAN